MSGKPSYQDLEQQVRDLKKQIDSLNKTYRAVVENSTDAVFGESWDGGPFELEYRIRDAKGDSVWQLDRSIGWSRDNGESIIHGVAADITERKKAEKALRESEEKLRLFIEYAPVALAMFDLEMCYIAVSKRWKKDYRLGDQHIVGRSHYEIFPEIPDRWKEAHRRGLEGEMVRSDEDIFQRTDGTHHWLRWEVRPWFLADDSIGGIIIFSEDITQRKHDEIELRQHRHHLEELVRKRTKELDDRNLQLEQANADLRELDRLKSMFVASMSHELRTPLNSIIGFTGIILQGLSGEINAEQQDQLQRVYRAAKHLLALISDVIDISKIEAGKIDIKPETFDLSEAIQETVAIVSEEMKIKGLDLQWHVPSNLMVKTDRKRLVQCILNCLSNAAKFTERGSVIIRADRVMENESRDEKDKPLFSIGNEPVSGPASILIRISDTGIGISRKDLPRVFESFVRIDSPLSVTTPGTGLGLYLTRKLVTEALNGSISVESVVGKGSTFSIRIPQGI